MVATFSIVPMSGIEQRGLLRPDSFEIDDADSESTHPEESRFGARRRWKPSSACLRPRNLLFCLVLTLGLIVVGVYWLHHPRNLWMGNLER